MTADPRIEIAARAKAIHEEFEKAYGAALRADQKNVIMVDYGFRALGLLKMIALDAARPEVEADALAQATELVARWEHGDEKHRQWLREIAIPDIARALTAARAPVAPDAWLPIQTAPRDGTLVLLWNKGAVEPFLARYANDRWRNNHYGEREVGWYFANPTHWQPSPNPPTEATGEKR